MQNGRALDLDARSLDSGASEAIDPGIRSLDLPRPGPREWFWDAALALLVAVTALVHVSFAPPIRTDIDTFGYALVVVGSLALVARRRYPVTVLLVSTACVLAYQMVGYPGIAAGLPVLVAIYTAVRSGHRALAATVTGLALVKGAAATLLMSVPEESFRDVFESRLLLAGWLVASGVTAEVIRKQHAYLHQVEQRAAAAERSQEETALRRAGEERLRIARELHDSLTHSISVIKVQAGVAVHLARKRGEQVPEALLAIQEASADATRELRATLDVLRSDDEPTDVLDRLPALVASTEAAGVPVTVTVTGKRCALPPEVDRAVYRIVQEALTNVARHAGPATAAVGLDYRPRRLVVVVDDDGAATEGSPPVPGMGLQGMRERVAALGGHLATEPRPEGGFGVRAELPVPSSAPVEPRDRVEGQPSNGGIEDRTPEGLLSVAPTEGPAR